MRFLPLLVLTIAAAGCASGGATSERSGPPSRWSGNFQPQQQLSGSVEATGSARMFGTVSLSPVSDPNRTRITLMINSPVGNTTLKWAVFPGRCGSPSLPVMAVDRFPPLEFSANGRGQLDVELALTYPTSGTYHVAVFRGNGTDASDTIACANLRS